MTAARPVALVTGAARRIGAAIARRLHADGYDLALHYHRSQGEMQALADALQAQRDNSVLTLCADLAEFDRLPELVAHCLGRFGRLDALVNNASNFFPTPFPDATPGQWDALMAVNARAPLFLSQAAAPHLAKAQGAIVNLVDIHAEQPLRGHPIYGMAKAALVHMTRALALELAPEVRVNAVAPGAILWPEQPSQNEHGQDQHGRSEYAKSDAAKQALLSRMPLARIGTPEEVAETVRWLLHDATYMTGQVLRVDGGRTLTP